MGRHGGQHTETAGQRMVDERYVLLEEIGRGAAARVYLAHDTHLGREVAIKMLTQDAAADPAFVERFHREARAIASLNHPNVVKVYDWGSDADTDYMVMEYVPGGTLAQRLRDVERLDEAQALGIAAGVTRALAAAHERGIIHRDIKPDNVLLSEEDTPKVADFGIAYAQGVSNLTATNTICGTVAYISPEQARGTQLDGRSDLYSLGVVLFEMLAGRVPFPGTSMVEVAIKHVQTPPPALGALQPGLSLATARLVSRALAKDPHDRFPDARAMLRALEEASAGLTGLAIDRVTLRSALPRPVPARERSNRRPLLVAIPALVAIVAGGLLAAHAWSGGGRSPAAAGAPRRPAPGTPVKRTASGTHHHARTAVSHTPATRPPATLAPTAPPRVAAALGTSSPSQTVIRFYVDIGHHDFAAAAALWSPALRQADPPTEYIDQRFALTRFIWVDGVRVIQQDPAGRTATVAAHVTETLANGTGQQFTGAWRLVRPQGVWLLDRPFLHQSATPAPTSAPGLPDGHKKAHDNGHHGKGQNDNGGGDV